MINIDKNTIIVSKDSRWDDYVASNPFCEIAVACKILKLPLQKVSLEMTANLYLTLIDHPLIGSLNLGTLKGQLLTRIEIIESKENEENECLVFETENPLNQVLIKFQ